MHLICSKSYLHLSCTAALLLNWQSLQAQSSVLTTCIEYTYVDMKFTFSPPLLFLLLPFPSLPRLVRFRWVVPAGGDTKLRLLFSSQDEGQFDQTLGFEIAGTRRRYQLFCRGLCVVPTICREPRWACSFSYKVDYFDWWLSCV